MYIKRAIYFIILIITLGSCGKAEVGEEDKEVNFLFTKSSELIIEFRDKISNANDSLTIDSLSQLFERYITEINFSVDPYTDLKLSEQENDSIFSLLESFTKTKKEKLEILSEVTDTISELN